MTDIRFKKEAKWCLLTISTAWPVPLELKERTAGNTVNLTDHASAH